MLEEILNRDNMTKALRRVESNKGCSGVDGMETGDLLPFLNAEWTSIKAEILDGTYKPKAVKQVEIPKPNGGKRNLGIPTVLDRLIQQAISQKLNEMYDKGFSESSYGFRPQRSAHQAVIRAQEYLNAGYTKVIEFDLEKFFDKVNHDRLMTTLARRINDKRLLKLIHKYLKGGVMVGGMMSLRTEGTPQGSPLSPILSNIVLDELDKELEHRGHKFVRYADDISIYVRSDKSAVRVKESITRFIEGKLKLKVNQTKSKISSPNDSQLLGFTFNSDEQGFQIRISKKSYQKLKEKLRKLTSRKWSINMEERLKRLKKTTSGWVNYFRIAKCRNQLKDLDGWIRFRLRMCKWKTWKRIGTRITNLVKLGLNTDQATQFAYTRKGHCRIAHSPILTRTLTNNYFTKLGYVKLEDVYLKWQS